MLSRPVSDRPDGAATYITAGLSLQSWTHIESWLRQYKGFLAARARRRRLGAPTPTMMRDNGLALDFLAAVARQQRGRTCVPAAIRAIDFIRPVLGIAPVKDDPRVQLLVSGVQRSIPHVPKGARPFPAMMVVAVASAWSSSRRWWKRMITCMLLVSFLALVRGAGIRTVPSAGVTWIRGMQEFCNPTTLPARHSGVILLIPKRKSSQATPSWVPLRACKATVMLARHVRWLRARAPENKFLFPARSPFFKNGKRQWRPHKSNGISAASFTRLTRKALSEVCGLSTVDAGKFTIHGLRVGGINFYRKQGVSVSLRAQMADHKSIETSRRYLRLLPHEQFATLSSAVLPQ